MSTPTVALERFSLEGALGEGAQLQVFAATDAETRRRVVVKRPHPTLVVRNQHRDVEQALARTIALREQLAESLRHVSRLVGYAPASDHDAYFGDTLGHPYTVTVEERARGLPLVGSALDGVKRMPIGLPHNLFALHPVVAHAQRGRFEITREILDVAEVFHKAGYLLLDLRPENVFFDPKEATITVIDVGEVAVERPATRRHPPLDLHDFYVELLKWHTTPADPPAEAAAYAKRQEIRSVPAFAQDVRAMIQEHALLPQEASRSAAMAILKKVQARGYGALGEFRRDLEAYLALARERYARLAQSAPLVEAWEGARRLLFEPYWRKFLFDPEADLAPYEGR